ncbi:MAG: hypothetical protein ACI9WS_000032 [Paraglaciecola psychrophila]|jgi:hypothetical protein
MRIIARSSKQLMVAVIKAVILALVAMFCLLSAQYGAAREYSFVNHYAGDFFADVNAARQVEDKFVKDGKAEYADKLVKPYVYATMEGLGLGHAKKALVARYVASFDDYDVLFSDLTEHKTLEVGVEYFFDSEKFSQFYSEQLRTLSRDRRYTVLLSIDGNNGVAGSPLAKHLIKTVSEDLADSGVEVVSGRNPRASDLAQLAIKISNTQSASEVHGVSIISDKLHYQSSLRFARAGEVLSEQGSISGVDLLKTSKGGGRVYRQSVQYFDDVGQALRDKIDSFKLRQRSLDIVLQGSSSAAQQFYLWLRSASIGINGLEKIRAGDRASTSIVNVSYRGSADNLAQEIKLHSATTALGYRVDKISANTVSISIAGN